jgi:hypothetical protein
MDKRHMNSSDSTSPQSTSQTVQDQLSALLKRERLESYTGPAYLTSLVSMLVPESTSSQSSNGGRLFSVYVKDPSVLQRDVLTRPAHYDDDSKKLIESLCDGTKSLEELSRKESTLLDLAVIQYASASAPESQSPEVEREESDEEVEHLSDDDLPTHDVPELSLPPEVATFWWQKKPT